MATKIIPERKSVSQPFLRGLCPTKRGVPFQHFGSCSYLVCFQFLSNSSFSYLSFQFQTSILQGEHQQRMKRQPTLQNPAGNPSSFSFLVSGRINFQNLPPNCPNLQAQVGGGRIRNSTVRNHFPLSWRKQQ